MDLRELRSAKGSSELDCYDHQRSRKSQRAGDDDSPELSRLGRCSWTLSTTIQDAQTKSAPGRMNQIVTWRIKCCYQSRTRVTSLSERSQKSTAGEKESFNIVGIPFLILSPSQIMAAKRGQPISFASKSMFDVLGSEDIDVSEDEEVQVDR